MGETQGFMKYARTELAKEPAAMRVKHWNEFIHLLPSDEARTQAARCMDCGTPFCHNACPVSNLVPEWNDLVYRGQWKEAVALLRSTNNFPEITGRVCPALCENSCVCALNQPAVAIKNIELTLIEWAYRDGLIRPRIPAHRTGKQVAVIGSGPAGLACADQLNQAGHAVTVFEKNEVVGGLLSLGIPDFKLGKAIVDRRVELMRREGVTFRTGVHVGSDVRRQFSHGRFAAVVLACGAEVPRDLVVPGRELSGVHFALEYLFQQNRINRGMTIPADARINASGKRVVVIGGGDTGSDCVGTANRQGAREVIQIELLPRPPEVRREDNPWPQWAVIYRRSSSHDEGVTQEYCIQTKSFSGTGGAVKKLHAVRVSFGEKDPVTGRQSITEIPGSEFVIECDLVFLAMGFVGPVKNGLLEELGVSLDSRGTVKTDEHYMTSVEGVFSAGDMRRGQSLVVWAMSEGRAAAEGVHSWLSRQR